MNPRPVLRRLLIVTALFALAMPMAARAGGGADGDDDVDLSGALSCVEGAGAVVLQGALASLPLVSGLGDLFASAVDPGYKSQLLDDDELQHTAYPERDLAAKLLGGVGSAVADVPMAIKSLITGDDDLFAMTREAYRGTYATHDAYFGERAECGGRNADEGKHLAEAREKRVREESGEDRAEDLEDAEDRGADADSAE